MRHPRNTPLGPHGAGSLKELAVAGARPRAHPAMLLLGHEVLTRREVKAAGRVHTSAVTVRSALLGNFRERSALRASHLHSFGSRAFRGSRIGPDGFCRGVWDVRNFIWRRPQGHSERAERAKNPLQLLPWKKRTADRRAPSGPRHAGPLRMTGPSPSSAAPLS